MKSKKKSDADLVEMILDSKTELMAFEALFERHSKSIFAFILSISKDYYIADEVTQNVFIHLWEKRKSLDNSKSLKALLFSIAYNEMISQFRKLKSENVKRKNFSSANVTEEQIEFDIEFKNLQELANGIINKLPERRLEIFRLSKEQGLTNKEISQKLSISLKTVENQITELRKTLKRQMFFIDLE